MSIGDAFHRVVKRPAIVWKLNIHTGTKPRPGGVSMLKEDGDKVSMLSGGVPADKVKAKVKAKSKQELEAEKRNKRRAVSRPGPARDILVKVDQGDLAEDGSKNKEDKGRPAVMPGRDKMVQLGRDKAVADKRERLSDNKTPRMTDRTLPKIR